MPVNASARSCRLTLRQALRSLCVLIGSLAVLVIPAVAAASPVVPSRPVSTANVTTTLVRAVPTSFLGFSMNDEEMEDFTNPPEGTTFGSIINNILNTNGNGPFVFASSAGTYVDSSYWNGEENLVLPQYQANPAFSVYLNQTWMDSLADVVQATGSKVILNVNAVAHSPQMASDFIQDAQNTLPSNSLMAVGIGNEPDDYNTAIIPVARNAAWARGLTPATFASIFGTYARVLHRTAAGIPLAGPESTGGETNWTSVLLQHDAPQVGLVTSHIYPLTACAAPGTATYPTVFKYLQNSLYQQTTDGLNSLMTLANNLNLPYRLTELGSGTCGGVDGVNNTFATSLWAINQLFSFMSAGLDGVNVHLRADTPNTAIEQNPALTGGLQAEPLLYGLAAFANALEPNDVLTQVSGQLQPDVSVWAVYGSEGWHLVLVNGSSSSQLVNLTVPATGAMTVTPLSAPAPWSNQVSFGGQTITPQGTWSGALDSSQVQPSSGTYPVVLPAASAVVADVSAASGTTISAAIKRRSTPAKPASKRKPAKHKPAKRGAAKRKAAEQTAKRRARAKS